MKDKGKDKQVFSLQSRVLAVVLITFASLGIYLNSLGGEFLWDDIHFIKNNVYLQNWSYLKEIFSGNVAAGSGVNYPYYRPLATLTYLIDHSLWGLNVRGYHLSNILFHILAAICLYALIDLLFKDRLLSFLTSLLFVIHPIHTETVAYISGRPDSLAAMFMLISFLLYLRQLDHSKRHIYFLMILSYLGAVLSRENSIVLPALLLLYHFAFKRRIIVRQFLPVAIIALVYVLLRFIFLEPMGPHPTLAERVPGFFVAIANYFRIILLPFHLHQEYGMELFALSDPRVIWGMGVVASISACCLIGLFRGKRRSHKDFTLRPGPDIDGGRFLCFCVLWFFIALSPVSGLFPLKTYMAEHWLYVPSMGLCLLVAYGLTHLYRKGFRWVITLVIVALVVFYGALTMRQNSYFRDPISFYERTLRYTPQSARLHNNLGIKYLESGEIAKGMAQFKQAI